MEDGHPSPASTLLCGYPPVAAWWFGHGVFLAAAADAFSPQLLNYGEGGTFRWLFLRTESQNVYRIERYDHARIVCTDARDGVPFEALIGLSGSGQRGELSTEFCLGERACLGGRVATSPLIEIVAVTDSCIHRGTSMDSIRGIADLHTEGSLTLLPTEFQDRLAALRRSA